MRITVKSLYQNNISYNLLVVVVVGAIAVKPVEIVLHKVRESVIHWVY